VARFRQAASAASAATRRTGTATPAAAPGLSAAPAPAAAALPPPPPATVLQSAPVKPVAQAQPANVPFAAVEQTPLPEQSCASSLPRHVSPEWQPSQLRQLELCE